MLRWLTLLAEGDAPRPVDIHLVREIHDRWFASTFPADAGRERAEMVLNRKGTAVAVDAIVPAVVGACENWNWRREKLAPDGDELVEFIVTEANTLCIAIYDVHPFIDGNTRTTWHLRNYLLMLDGLRPVGELTDFDRYDDLWWSASPTDHAELDQVVLEELAAQDRR